MKKYITYDEVANIDGRQLAAITLKNGDVIRIRREPKNERASDKKILRKSLTRTERSSDSYRRSTNINTSYEDDEVPNNARDSRIREIRQSINVVRSRKVDRKNCTPMTIDGALRATLKKPVYRDEDLNSSERASFKFTSSIQKRYEYGPYKPPQRSSGTSFKSKNSLRASHRCPKCHKQISGY